MKKPPSKVAYFSRILVVSEIFHNTAQQPKWQISCSKMWPTIEQLYIELGKHVTVEKHLVFDGFLSFFTDPNPIIVYIVICSKIMIKIVKVGNWIMILKERKLT